MAAAAAAAKVVAAVAAAMAAVGRERPEVRNWGYTYAGKGSTYTHWRGSLKWYPLVPCTLDVP